MTHLGLFFSVLKDETFQPVIVVAVLLINTMEQTILKQLNVLLGKNSK